jgi:hypothetical protein
MIGRIVTKSYLDYTETENPRSLNTILSDLQKYRTASGRDDVAGIIITKAQKEFLFGRYLRIETIWGYPLEVRG